MSESTESGSDEPFEEDETQKTGQCSSVVDGSSQESDSKSITAGLVCCWPPPLLAKGLTQAFVISFPV